jgi:hypothetical protein
VYSCWRKTYPQSHVHWLCQPTGTTAFPPCPPDRSCS